MLTSDPPGNNIYVCCFFNEIKNHPRRAVMHPATITVARRYAYGTAERQMAMDLGFRNDSEYASMYPGGFKLESTLSRLMNLNVDVSDPDETSKILNVSPECYGNAEHDPKNLREMLVSFFAVGTPHLMASVTMDAVRGCRVFRNESDDDLWFCIDWKGW